MVTPPVSKLFDRWIDWKAKCASIVRRREKGFSPLLLPLLLSALIPLSLLFVPALLPRWGLFWTWKSHIPKGLCGPAALYVSQIDTHTYAHRHIQTSTHMPPCSPQIHMNTHTLAHTPCYSSLKFFRAPRAGGSCLPLSQCRSSLTFCLSKHRGRTLLFWSFLSLFAFNWCR